LKSFSKIENKEGFTQIFFEYRSHCNHGVTKVKPIADDWILSENIDEKKELYIIDGKKVKRTQPELQKSIPFAHHKEILLKINQKN
jgi:hypothetical protein